jgi:hypothetical protein
MNGRVGVIGLADRFMGIYDRTGQEGCEGEAGVAAEQRLSVLLGEGGRKHRG